MITIAPTITTITIITITTIIAITITIILPEQLRPSTSKEAHGQNVEIIKSLSWSQSTQKISYDPQSKEASKRRCNNAWTFHFLQVWRSWHLQIILIHVVVIEIVIVVVVDIVIMTMIMILIVKMRANKIRPMFMVWYIYVSLLISFMISIHPEEQLKSSALSWSSSFLYSYHHNHHHNQIITIWIWQERCSWCDTYVSPLTTGCRACRVSVSSDGWDQ